MEHMCHNKDNNADGNTDDNKNDSICTDNNNDIT